MRFANRGRDTVSCSCKRKYPKRTRPDWRKQLLALLGFGARRGEIVRPCTARRAAIPWPRPEGLLSQTLRCSKRAIRGPEQGLPTRTLTTGGYVNKKNSEGIHSTW